MSLAHFAVWYNVADLNKQPGVQPRYKLQNNEGQIYLRCKQACLRVLTVTHGDNYCYLLVLYCCWSNETVDVIDSPNSSMASFVANRD